MFPVFLKIKTCIHEGKPPSKSNSKLFLTNETSPPCFKTSKKLKESPQHHIENVIQFELFVSFPFHFHFISISNPKPKKCPFLLHHAISSCVHSIGSEKRILQFPWDIHPFLHTFLEHKKLKTTIAPTNVPKHNKFILFSSLNLIFH